MNLQDLTMIEFALLVNMQNIKGELTGIKEKKY